MIRFFMHNLVGDEKEKTFAGESGAGLKVETALRFLLTFQSRSDLMDKGVFYKDRGFPQIT